MDAGDVRVLPDNVLIRWRCQKRDLPSCGLYFYTPKRQAEALLQSGWGWTCPSCEYAVEVEGFLACPHVDTEAARW
jgi:hypothetical protein